MAWIESHIDLGDHPKVTELCFNLHIKKYEAVGHLHLLWHFTMKYAWRNGDLCRFTPRTICEAIGWDKDPDTFIRALHETGWLEKDTMIVHDWLEYSGKLVKDRIYNEERRKTSFVAVTSRKTSATLPNPTLPNPTLPKDLKTTTRRFEKPTAQQVSEYSKSILFNLDGQQFIDYYEAKGWVVGRSPMKSWQATVRTWKSRRLKNGFNGNDENRNKSTDEYEKPGSKFSGITKTIRIE